MVSVLQTSRAIASVLHYKVDIENDHVRVMRASFDPHKKNYDA